ncbi:MAG TPA: GNAT family N-acetyltransferase [Candidatus Binatus sp.]|jgi:L-amino acid N-acyltransferase YncA|nr:GNAT family N-acetyltransferase [Candidatus Binatus sp.]
MNYPILPMPPELWPAVREIYAQGIATGNATFETEFPDWEKWDAGHRKDCRLVALEPFEQNAELVVPLEKLTVLGWAALSPVSARRVYAGVAEVSVYVATAARGRGVGKALLQTLVHESEANGIWTLQAGIFPENVASISLHQSCGFREVGRRRHIGQLRELWRDVLLLERRSSTIGT